MGLNEVGSCEGGSFVNSLVTSKGGRVSLTKYKKNIGNQQNMLYMWYTTTGDFFWFSIYLPSSHHREFVKFDLSKA